MPNWGVILSVMLAMPAIGKFLDDYYVSSDQRTKLRNAVAMIRKPLQHWDSQAAASDMFRYAWQGVVGVIIWVAAVYIIEYLDRTLQESGIGLELEPNRKGWQRTSISTAAVLVRTAVGLIGFVGMIAVARLALALVALPFIVLVRPILLRLFGPAVDPKHSPLTYFGSLMSATLGLVKAVGSLFG